MASATMFTAASYMSAPTLVVAALSPQSVFIYAIADRLSRLMFMITAPIHDWMQGSGPGNR